MSNVEQMQLTNQALEPSSSIGVFELPCGYLTEDGQLLTEVKLREITGVEEDMLASKSVPGGKKITHLIAGCMERIGALADKSQFPDIARALTVGDRVFLMLAVRRVTLGDQYPFTAKCPECGKSRLYEVDLGGLAIKKMEDPKKRVYDTELPSSKLPVRFHVMTGKEEEKLAKTSEQDDQLSLTILARVELIGGKPASVGVLKRLGMIDRTFLRDQFNEVEGGLDMEVEIACGSCGEEFKIDLDIGQPGFFFPSRTQKNSKVNTSS